MIKTRETDVPTLQKMAKENWELYVRAVERLKKARRQRDEARAAVQAVRALATQWREEAKHIREAYPVTYEVSQTDQLETCAKELEEKCHVV